MNWKESLGKLSRWNVPTRLDNTAAMMCLAAGAAIGCLEHHLRRRRAIDITKAFVRYAHGNHRPEHQQQYWELYREFCRRVDEEDQGE